MTTNPGSQKNSLFHTYFKQTIIYLGTTTNNADKIPKITIKKTSRRTKQHKYNKIIISETRQLRNKAKTTTHKRIQSKSNEKEKISIMLLNLTK